MRLPRLQPLHRALVLAALLVVILAALPALTPSSPRAAAPEGGVALRSEASGPLRPGYFLVLALLGGGGLWALRLRKRAAGSEATPLQAMGQLALGQQGQLRLVRCGDEVLLLGVTGQQVTLLRTYGVDTPPPAPLPAAAPPPPANAAPPPAFADLLRAAGLPAGRAAA